MTKKILVPLDGSKLGECVLGYVEDLAKGCGMEVDLFVAVPQMTTPIGATDIASSYAPSRRRDVEDLIEEVEQRDKAEVNSYLEKVGRGLKEKGIKVQTSVHVGDPAAEIIAHAGAVNVDFILMASHGRSGPAKVAFGSVADKVLKTSNVPVMIVRPSACRIK